MRIIAGDCIHEMCTLKRKGKTFDLIITDPPYNQGVDYGGGTDADNLLLYDYQNWCESWIDCLVCDMLASEGSLWLIVPWQHSAWFTCLGRRATLILRNVIIWHETFGQYSQNNFGNCHRHLLYFTKSPWDFTFNADAVRVESRRQQLGDKRADVRGKVRSNVWEIPRIVGNSNERIKDAPNQLPLALIKPIIAACSNPGDTVLDPFCGTGTTGVVAGRMGRDFTGIELNPVYAVQAEQRILDDAGSASGGPS